MTIKHPPAAIEGFEHDNSVVGKVFDMPAQLAILMIAAGWVRSDTRGQARRHHEEAAGVDRRQTRDRRSPAA